MAYMTDENGNFRRTVRCGYCYEKGHNKGSCEQRKTDLKNRIEKYTQELADGVHTEDWHRNSVQRRLEDAKTDLNKMLSKGKGRACGFCRTAGHQRRTCPERKAQGITMARETIDFRKKVAKRMAADGIGVGTLVDLGDQIKGTSGLAIITSIDFVDLTLDTKVSKETYVRRKNIVNCRMVVPFKHYGRMIENTHCHLPFDCTNVDELLMEESSNSSTAAWHPFKVMSPVTVDAGSLIPAENLNEKAVSTYLINEFIDPR